MHLLPLGAKVSPFTPHDLVSILGGYILLEMNATNSLLQHRHKQAPRSHNVITGEF